MKKLFVWDFHGTLEKGNERSARAYIDMVLEAEGYERRITGEEEHLLYGRKIFDYFAYLCPGESDERYMELQDIFLNMEHTHPHILQSNILPNDGAHEVIKAISESLHEQIIISNVEVSMLAVFIHAVGLESYFPEGTAFATNTHRGAQFTKHDMLKTYIMGKQFDHFVAIGDAPKDLDYVEEYPHTTYMYAHPGNEFRDYTATHMIRDLREVLKEI